MTTEMATAMGYDEAGNCAKLLARVDAEALEAGDFRRVAGEARCPRCGSAYRLHPPVQGALWLTRGCDGLVKL